jgi:hypothetical protein
VNYFEGDKIAPGFRACPEFIEGGDRYKNCIGFSPINNKYKKTLQIKSMWLKPRMFLTLIPRPKGRGYSNQHLK